MILDHGCKAGLAFNPATPLHYLDYTLDKLDLVLLMSVNPGFGGQAFIPATLTKLQQARSRIASSGRDILLQIDGGVKLENIADIATAGADTFVAGSAIFGARNRLTAIATIAFWHICTANSNTPHAFFPDCCVSAVRTAQGILHSRKNRCFSKSA